MSESFLTQATNWLNTPDADRDYEKGALLFLQISQNRIMYNNLARRPQYYAKHIEYQIEKWVKQKTSEITHEQVVALEEKAAKIMEALPKENEEETAKDDSPVHLRGKRADHDTLPLEIQALYTENYTIISRMRECHLQVRNASGPNQSCIDADKWAFLNELISLDKKLHSNWKQYDCFVLDEKSKIAPTPQPKTLEPSSANPEIVAESEKCLRMVNLNKGKYRKNPNEALKKRIHEWYSKIVNPSPKLVKELKELGILNEA